MGQRHEPPIQEETAEPDPTLGDFTDSTPNPSHSFPVPPQYGPPGPSPTSLVFGSTSRAEAASSRLGKGMKSKMIKLTA